MTVTNIENGSVERDNTSSMLSSSGTRDLTADRGDAGQRLDLVVRRHAHEVSRATRTRIQAWIAEGRVLVNGISIRRAAARVACGDTITVLLPHEVVRQKAAPEEIGLHVLHEDEFLLAVNKPPGMVAHPSYRNPTGTLMNALLWYARGWHSSARPSLVGRLDKLTSGIVLVAKSAPMHAALQRATIDKDYLAVSYGRVNALRGLIGLRLMKDRRRRRTVVSANAGVESLTRFERLARVAAPRAGLTLLRCRLGTGRTHQIRVHLAARGWPIVGDPVYGEPRWTEVVDPKIAAALRAFPRQALHAWRLAFMHPMTKGRLEIEAPLPNDMAELFKVTGIGSSEVRVQSSD
jgi:23S rRNA pseudouridine1911/1915/1917 synthase